MTDDTSPRGLARAHLEMDESSLFALLAPNRPGQHTLYSREGRAVQGKAVFRTTLEKVRAEICGKLRNDASRLQDRTELTVLIAATLEQLSPGTSAFPIAALIVKIGFDELCREVKNGC